jgi:membrane-associated protease RseP (regulator of RpoE activity)
VVERWATATLLCLAAGCAAPQFISYHARSYVAVVDEDRPSGSHKSPDIEVTDDVDAAAARLYERGYRLIGYSQFVSPLLAALANVNAKATAKSKGADHVLAAPPRPAAMDQNYFLATYWRAPTPTGFLFGAYYTDPPRPLIAVVGCEDNRVAVLDVAAGSPAANAGIVRGDVIRTFDGKPVTSAAQLDRLLVGMAGRNVAVVLTRRGDPISVTVALNGRPAKKIASLDDSTPPFGVDLEPVKFTKAERKTYHAKTGYFVGGLEADEAGCAAGLRAGDLLTTIDRKRFESPEQLRKAASRSKLVSVTYVRGQRDYTTQLDPSLPAQPRLAIAEATYGAPWHSHAVKDWSAMTAALMISQSMLDAANRYTAAVTAQEQARREAYFRGVQTAQSQAPKLVTERGRTFVRTTNGAYVQIDSNDAAALAQHPDANIEVGRNGRAYLTDSLGARIYTQTAARPVAAPTMPKPYVTDDFAAGLTQGAVITAQTAAQWDHFWTDYVFSLTK